MPINPRKALKGVNWPLNTEKICWKHINVKKQNCKIFSKVLNFVKLIRSKPFLSFASRICQVAHPKNF